MNIARLFQALDFAAQKHQEQRRKGGQGTTPYINHPITVARVLAEIGGVQEEEVLLAAILHDTLEDTATTGEELESLFGSVVRGLVEEVTDDKSLPKAERKRLQIEHACQLSSGAVLIKLADKIANVRDMGDTPPADWPRERVGEYLTWAETVVQNCPRVNAALESYFQEVLRQARKKGAFG